MSAGSRSQSEIDPDRPPRPRWVYIAGALVIVFVLGAVLFALAFRSEEYVAPDRAAPPILTPPSAPTDGEASDSARQGHGE